MRGWVRTGLAGAGAAGMLLAAAAAPALAAGPSVTLDPPTVTTSGQLITVQVTGCPVGQQITVSSSDAAHDISVNADGAGSATTSVASGATPGTFTVSAACGGATSSASYTIVARS